MYKCSECGTEYETKPDFCDCGNDTFTEVEITTTNEANTENYESLKNNTNVSLQEQKKQIPDNSHFSGNTIRIPKKQKTFSEQYPGITRLFSSIDPLSGVIFLICLILSVFVISIPVPEKTVNEANVISNEKTTNIPSINSFWNDEPPAVKTKQPLSEPKSEPIIEIVQNIIPLQKKQKTEQKPSVPIKKASTTSAVQKTKTVSKTPSQPKSAAQQKSATPVSANKSATPSNQKEQKVQTVNTPAMTQVKTETTQPAKQVTVNNNTDPAVIAAQQAKKNAESKAELASYKISLRNAIGRKIDFTRVLGDGSCAVSFKVNSSGQLVNRSFTKQSDNLTLNDAVYKAVMATPSYNTPPSSYKYETLNLNIKIYNGNFEISLN